MSNLNSQIKEAVDSFDVELARKLLKTAFKDADSETFYLASLVSLNDSQKVKFLKKAIELDPFNSEAQNDLENMEKRVSQQRKQAPARVDEKQEMVLLQTSDIVVTTKKFVAANTTYMINKINSVKMQVIEKQTGWKKLYIIVGMMCIFLSIAVIASPNTVSTAESNNLLGIFILLGFGLLYLARPDTGTYGIAISLSSGEVTAYTTKEIEHAQNIVNAIIKVISM